MLHARNGATRERGFAVGVTLNNRTLVTVYGGSGFLGRHLVRAIARTGARIRV
ncbi:MAG: complex I NDUFA9 subunit family protein, partial [Methyloceanibacter sp.]